MATKTIVITTCDGCGAEIPSLDAKDVVQLEVAVKGSRARRKELDLHVRCVAPTFLPEAIRGRASSSLRVAAPKAG